MNHPRKGGVVFHETRRICLNSPPPRDISSSEKHRISMLATGYSRPPQSPQSSCDVWRWSLHCWIAVESSVNYSQLTLTSKRLRSVWLLLAWIHARCPQHSSGSESWQVHVIWPMTTRCTTWFLDGESRIIDSMRTITQANEITVLLHVAVIIAKF